MLLAVLVVLVSSSVLAELPAPEKVRAAAEDPSRVAALLDGLTAYETAEVVAQLLTEAGNLPLSGEDQRIRVVQILAAAVSSTGASGPQAAWGGLKSVDHSLLETAVAASALAAGDQLPAVTQWILDAVPETDAAAVEKAAESPAAVLGPLLTQVARDAMAGFFGVRGLQGASSLAAPSPVARRAPVPQAVVTTPVTSTTTVPPPPPPPPPVAPPYAGQSD